MTIPAASAAVPSAIAARTSLLLSTVHWVATHDEDAAKSEESAVMAVHAWNTRKATTMKPEHVRTAWKHLQAKGWI